MKINFDKIITDIDGKSIIENNKKITLKDVCVNALLAVIQDEKIDGKEKLDRYNIAMKINDSNNKEIELTIEEVAEIKELIGKVYSVLIVGRVYNLLEESK